MIDDDRHTCGDIGGNLAGPCEDLGKSRIHRDDATSAVLDGSFACVHATSPVINPPKPRPEAPSLDATYRSEPVARAAMGLATAAAGFDRSAPGFARASALGELEQAAYAYAAIVAFEVLGMTGTIGQLAELTPAHARRHEPAVRVVGDAIEIACSCGWSVRGDRLTRAAADWDAHAGRR